MKRFQLVIVVVSVLLAAAVAGQAQEKKSEKKPAAKMEMPKPGPEVKKLAYFAGTWTSEGDLKENSFGMPAGKFSSTDKCEWFTGGYQLVCNSTGKGAMGTMHGMYFLTWNPNEKMYVYYGIDSMGMAQQSKGKADGDSWVYTSEEMMGGKTYHGRYSVNIASPDSYTFKYESSEDGQKWATIMEGKATKVAAKK